MALSKLYQHIEIC